MSRSLRVTIAKKHKVYRVVIKPVKETLGGIPFACRHFLSSSTSALNQPFEVRNIHYLGERFCRLFYYKAVEDKTPHQLQNQVRRAFRTRRMTSLVRLIGRLVSSAKSKIWFGWMRELKAFLF